MHQEYDDEMTGKRIRSVKTFRIQENERLIDPVETVYEKNQEN